MFRGRRFSKGAPKRRKFGSKRPFNRRTTLTKPVTYKFAAPVQRAKLNLSFSFSTATDGKDISLLDWTVNGIAQGAWGVLGNDCKDPLMTGLINTTTAFGRSKSTKSRPTAWDEWMKLYRKCYVTGSKIRISLSGSMAGHAAGSALVADVPVTIALAAHDSVEDTKSHVPEIFTANPLYAAGNKNMKIKHIWAKSLLTLQKGVTAGDTQTYSYDPKHLYKAYLSWYKSTKSVFGLKTVFGDEQLSCDMTGSPEKVWCWNWTVTPPTGGFCKVAGLVNITYWCSFASRRAVAQVDDAADP